MKNERNEHESILELSMNGCAEEVVTIGDYPECCESCS